MSTPWPEGPYYPIMHPVSGTYQVRLANALDELVAIIAPSRSQNDPQVQALAVLIAAAPRMFDALESLLQYQQIEVMRDGLLVFECPDCGGRDGRHVGECEFARAQILINLIRGLPGGAERMTDAPVASANG